MKSAYLFLFEKSTTEAESIFIFALTSPSRSLNPAEVYPAAPKGTFGSKSSSVSKKSTFL